MKGSAILWILLVLFLLVAFGLLTWGDIFTTIGDFFKAIL